MFPQRRKGAKRSRKGVELSPSLNAFFASYFAPLRLCGKCFSLVVVLLISICCTLLPVGAQDDDVVRVETDLTNILFTAIDKDKRFVTTLQREDVRVFENDAVQEIFTFQRETDLPLSLVVLIDTSRSQKEVLPDEKLAARAFVDSVIRPDKDQAAIISFTGKPTIEQALTNDLESLRSGIERVTIKLPPDEGVGGRIATPQDIADPNYDDTIGYTSIWDSLSFTAREVLTHTPDRTRRAIILLSDGDDTFSRIKREEAIDEAIKANVFIYSIGIGSADNGVEEDTLRKVSEKTGGKAFFPEDERELKAAFAQIEAELRSQYALAYTPSNRTRDGSYRRIRLEIVNAQLKKQKLRLLYRQGYYAKQAAK
jgi:Ca-activated chloride channel family protein